MSTTYNQELVNRIKELTKEIESLKGDLSYYQKLAYEAQENHKQQNKRLLALAENIVEEVRPPNSCCNGYC